MVAVRQVDGAGDAAVSDSACLVSRVLSGVALVAASGVAAQAGHKPLGIVAFDHRGPVVRVG